MEDFQDYKSLLINDLNKIGICEIDYSITPHELFFILCDHFSVSIARMGKKKTKKMLDKFRSYQEFTKESFLFSYELVTRFADQEDVMRARQVLGNDEYFMLLGNYNKDLSLTDRLVIGNSKNFYSSPEWLRLRYQAFRVYRNYCQCCGSKRSDKITLHADHIIPRSVRPDLALSLSNIQILCDCCNTGKSNIDATDWREEDEKIK